MEGVRPIILDAFNDYTSAILNRTPLRHTRAAEQLVRRLQAQTQGVLNMRRDLLCVQLRVTNTPKGGTHFHQVETERYHNAIFDVILGQVWMLDPDTISSRNRLWDERLRSPVVAGVSKWRLASWQPRALFEPDMDEGNEELAMDPQASEAVQGIPIERVIKDRLRREPQFVCPQSTVLSDIGYSQHCVHMGLRYNVHNPAVFSPNEQFAVRCGGRFPRGTVFVAVRHREKQEKKMRNGKALMKSTVESVPVMRVCGATGWEPEQEMPEEDGSETLRLCHSYLDGMEPRLTTNDLLMSGQGMVRDEKPTEEEDNYITGRTRRRWRSNQKGVIAPWV
eukprot:Protomagalhaensia_sp_Gyna_25__2946@NODE_272_length_4095_cov_4_236193_g210_i0_p2_GENE_NODE_272_length_4095_cov_4_236193_g210_i0NODE_272_length_4095_cov_4_236193_g210_i0_p2_ORF_typecomplete_len376_score63_05_NODE_272_length_4095_cov_4_236193_g210_i01211128